MKYEINNGRYVGSAEWIEPGRVVLTMDDPRERAFFERYFTSEDCHLGGPVECAEMVSERPNESEEAFQRSVFRLSAYAYRVTDASSGGSSR